MNWEPVISAWIVFLGLAIVGIFAIQTTPGLYPAFRRTAQFMFGIMCLAFDIFAVIAEFYRINFLWGILFATGVYIVALVLLLVYKSLREKRKKR